MGSASEPHANRIAERGHTQTQTQTQGRDVPFSAENGAAAPSRSSEQATVVAAYAVAAKEAGIPVLGRARAMIAGQAGLLLDDGWPPEAILRAVDRFARKRRFAGHLAQWCRENAADERTKEHEARKETDRRTVKDTMKRLGQAMREAGL